MNKLLILDKDGTLVRPKSGARFVQHPEDQELIPGVTDAIARYSVDGWMMAIASNQGGCDRQQIKATQLQAGQHVWTTEGSYLGKVTEVGSTIFYCGDTAYANQSWENVQASWIPVNSEVGDSTRYSAHSWEYVMASWKTLEDAIAEMQYCMGLLPEIYRVMFCPDYEGGIAVSLRKSHNGIHLSGHAASMIAYLDAKGHGWVGENAIDCWDRIRAFQKGSYRKPEPGMLLEIISDGFEVNSQKPRNTLFVGDRPEDEQAAKNAGVHFMWAEDWRETSLL